MTQFLGFRLAGILSSWGDVAVGDIRSSWPAPSASALSGLLAAALGIQREDKPGQQALLQTRFAVRLDHPGAPLRDYHTVQSARTEARAAPFRTRKDELERGKVGTKLTERTYWTGQVSTILAWGGDLAAMEAALRRPAFFLSLGRRACPPTRPLGPHLVEAPTIVDGFSAYDAIAPDGGPSFEEEGDIDLFWDNRPEGPEPGVAPVSVSERRDLPVSRGADWSFVPRPVAHALWPRSVEEGA